MDPKELTKEERRKIVDEIRERRKTFSLAKTQAKAAGKRTPIKAGVTLDDLGATSEVLKDLDSLLADIVPSKVKK